MTTAFQASLVSFERNDVALLQNINCALTPGQVLQIRGANGSGKSTLLRILAGYLEPQTGLVQWQQECIYTQAQDYQQQVHYLGHLSGIKQNLRVKENLELHLRLYGHNTTVSLEAAITRMGLHSLSESYAKQLSAGQLRRLALTRLILSHRDLWILDEPLTALDHDGQTLFHDLLQEHMTRGGMAIIATHHDLQLASVIQTLDLGSTHA